MVKFILQNRHFDIFHLYGNHLKKKKGLKLAPVFL